MAVYRGAAGLYGTHAVAGHPLLSGLILTLLFGILKDDLAAKLPRGAPLGTVGLGLAPMMGDDSATRTGTPPINGVSASACACNSAARAASLDVSARMVVALVDPPHAAGAALRRRGWSWR